MKLVETLEDILNAPKDLFTNLVNCVTGRQKILICDRFPVGIEDIIGGGKSALARTIAWMFGLGLLEEKVAKNPHLVKYYAALGAAVEFQQKHPDEVVPKAIRDELIAFQLWALEYRPEQQRKAFKRFNGRFVSDRTLPGDMAFYTTLLWQNMILQEEYDTLVGKMNEVFDQLTKEGCQYRTILWLETDPEIAFERMKRRARSMEDVVPLPYLQLLYKAYKEVVLPWLKEKGMNVVELDWNKDRPIRHSWFNKDRYFLKDEPMSVLDVLCSPTYLYLINP